MLLLSPLPASFSLAQDTASTPKTVDTEKKGSAGTNFVLERYPSLRLGRLLRIDLRAKIQADLESFSPERKGDDLLDLRRARLSLEGNFLRHFEYEVEGELRDTKEPWRDVYLNFRYFRDLQIQAGKFKLPFGRDRLTGITNLDYIARSRIGDQISPGRDRGIMAHGRLFKRGLSYQAGIFQGDGDNKGHAELTFAGRLTGTPFRLMPLPAVLKRMEFGAAITSGRLPEGLNSLRGRTVSRHVLFEPVYVRGERMRSALEFDWRPGPFSVTGEFIHATDERLGQGVRRQNLPHFITRGWYLSGTWALTGERKAGGIQPSKEFLRKGGFGALELAIRYEQLRQGSTRHPGPPLVQARAANLQGNSDRVWTYGINWYLNRFVKIQANLVREKIEDAQDGPIPGRERVWARLFRLQFAL